MSRARIIVRNTSGLSVEEAYHLRKSLSDVLGFDDEEALLKSTKTWRTHPIELYGRMEDAFFALLNLERFYKRLCSFLGLKAMVKGINYRADGTPLTDEQLTAINKFITEQLHIAAESVEAEAVRAFLVGRIAHQVPAPVRFNIDRLPKSLLEAAKTFNLSDVEVRAIDFARQSAGEAITNMVEDVRHQVVKTLIEAKKHRRGPSQLASDLWHEVAHKDEGIVRDWRRVAITEMNETANNGFLSSLRPGAYVVGKSFPDACQWCKKNIDGKVMVYVPNPPPDYSDFSPDSKKYQEIARIWDRAIWVGKSNYGRSSSPRKRTPKGLVQRQHHEMAGFAALCHVHGRCYPEEIDPDEMFIDERGRMQVKYLDEKGWNLWYQNNIVQAGFDELIRLLPKYGIEI